MLIIKLNLNVSINTLSTYKRTKCDLCGNFYFTNNPRSFCPKCTAYLSKLK